MLRTFWQFRPKFDWLVLITLLFCSGIFRSRAFGEEPVFQVASSERNAASSPDTSRIATLDTSDLKEFDAQPAGVQRLLTDALKLTKLNLPYRYGADNPDSGGMDCSGTMHYLLTEEGAEERPARFIRDLPVGVDAWPGVSRGQLRSGDL